MIEAKELMIRTGATYRQIDYWCSLGIISAVKDNGPGSGNKRKFYEEDVDRIKLMVRMSKAFNGLLVGKILKKLYEHYDDGILQLDEEVVLKWI